MQSLQVSLVELFVFNLLLIYKKTNKCNFVIKFHLLTPQYEWFSDLHLPDDIVNFSSVFLNFLHFFVSN